MKYEIRQVSAWNDSDGWDYNETWHITDFQTKAKNEKRAFVKALNKYGITFKKNRTRIDFDGDIYEITDRKTKEPLFAAIPMN